MTDKELERLERIAVQMMAGAALAHLPFEHAWVTAQRAIEQAQELIKQLDALKIPE